MIMSLVVIVVTMIISYIIESGSQKLPAVIRSDKVFMSAEVNGVLKEYSVTSMQKVQKNDPIAEIENAKLPLQLQTMQKEVRKYEEMIASAQGGDYLNIELLKLEEDIQNTRIDLEEARLEIKKIIDKLDFMEQRHIVTKKQYEANKKLYSNGLINNSDFEKVSDDYWKVHEDYFDLKGDSLIAYETMQTSQLIINTLNARKKILSQNTNMLSSKYFIDLNDIILDINELQEEINNLKIFSPITGIVTDINYRPGEGIDKGDVLVEIADLSNVWIIAYGDSKSSQRVKVGQKVRIFCSCSKKIWGKVVTVSPVMERVKSLSNSFETVNTYTKIEINFADQQEALKYITPGERLFVRIFFR